MCCYVADERRDLRKENNDDDTGAEIYDGGVFESAEDHCGSGADSDVVGEGEGGGGVMVKSKYPYPQVFHSLPRNDEDYEGGYVLYDTEDKVFYYLEFGTGDNLTADDIKEGYDDYMNLYSYSFTSKTPLLMLFRVMQYECDMDDLEADGEVEELDSAMMLIRRKDYGNTGDVRAYIANGLEMLCYSGDYKDLVFVCRI